MIIKTVFLAHLFVCSQWQLPQYFVQPWPCVQQAQLTNQQLRNGLKATKQLCNLSDLGAYLLVLYTDVQVACANLLYGVQAGRMCPKKLVM